LDKWLQNISLNDAYIVRNWQAKKTKTIVVNDV